MYALAPPPLRKLKQKYDKMQRHSVAIIFILKLQISVHFVDKKKNEKLNEKPHFRTRWLNQGDHHTTICE